MKKISIFLLFTIIIQIAYSQDFRNSEWGDSREKVITTETEKPLEQEKEYIVYKTIIAGMDAFAAYYFIENQLVRGIYLINQSHSNWNLYYQDYIRLQELLVEKYGDFVHEEKIWSDDTLKNNPNEIGTALKFGHVQLVTVWETEKAIIALDTTSDNSQVILRILYESIKHQDLINKKAIEGL